MVLYAPTYRYEQRQAGSSFDDMRQRYELSWSEIKTSLEDRFSKKACLVYRFHHVTDRGLDVHGRYPEGIDATDYPDMQELLLAADILITDYSSCFYDYLLLEKPILFYIFDEEEYSLARGVHEPVHKTAPGIICRTSEELIRTLEQRDVPRIPPQEHMIDMCLTNGSYTASDRILDAVFGAE
jgi:CDP-glycerol glycerophosphotransferase (TagB/SpsB family)